MKLHYEFNIDTQKHAFILDMNGKYYSPPEFDFVTPGGVQLFVGWLNRCFLDGDK